MCTILAYIIGEAMVFISFLLSALQAASDSGNDISVKVLIPENKPVLQCTSHSEKCVNAQHAYLRHVLKKKTHI